MIAPCRRLYGLGACVILLFGAAAAIRLGYVVRNCETAPDVLSQLAKESTIGWFGWTREPINQAEPAQQADFWIAQTDRILAQSPTSELACGAAWLLDAPGTGFQARHLVVTGLAPVPVMPDSKAITRATQAFDTKATPKCLAAAKLATQLDPANVNAWRTRALLQFGAILSPDAGRPRKLDWRETLAEAAAHDPDNALYDYLAADWLWQESVDYDFSQADPQLVIRDENRFAESRACFEQAQQKPLLRGADGEAQAVKNVLCRAGVAAYEQPVSIRGRLGKIREACLSMHLCRSELELAQRSPPATRLPLLQRALRLAEQLEPAGDLNRAQSAIWINDRIAGALLELLEHHRQELDASTATTVETELLAASVRSTVCKTALQDIKQPAPANPMATTLFHKLALDWCSSTGVLLAGAVLLLALVERFAGRGSACRPALGIGRTIASWLIAIGASLVLFGLAPTEIISISVQQAISRTVVLNLPWIAVVGVLLYFLRRRKWRFSLLEFVFVMPTLGALLLCWVTLAIAGSFEAEIGWHMPARQVGGLSPAVLRALAPALQQGTVTSVLYQWDTYAGPTVASLLALAIVAAWSLRREVSGESNTRQSWPDCLGSIALSARRAAAGGAVVTLIAVLCVAPIFLRQVETDYQWQMAQCLGQNAELDARTKAIESDESQMQEFRTSAEEFLPAQIP